MHITFRFGIWHKGGCRVCAGAEYSHADGGMTEKPDDVGQGDERERPILGGFGTESAVHVRYPHRTAACKMDDTNLPYSRGLRGLLLLIVSIASQSKPPWKAMSEASETHSRSSASAQRSRPALGVRVRDGRAAIPALAQERAGPVPLSHEPLDVFASDVDAVRGELPPGPVAPVGPARGFPDLVHETKQAEVDLVPVGREVGRVLPVVIGRAGNAQCPQQETDRVPVPETFAERQDRRRAWSISEAKNEEARRRISLMRLSFSFSASSSAIRRAPVSAMVSSAASVSARRAHERKVS